MLHRTEKHPSTACSAYEVNHADRNAFCSEGTAVLQVCAPSIMWHKMLKLLPQMKQKHYVIYKPKPVKTFEEQKKL